MLSSKINQNCQSCLCRRIISILQNWSRLIGTTQTPVFHWFTEICKTNFKFSIYSFRPIPPKQALLFIQLMANWVKNWSPRRFFGRLEGFSSLDRNNFKSDWILAAVQRQPTVRLQASRSKTNCEFEKANRKNRSRRVGSVFGVNVIRSQVIRIDCDQR